MDNTGQARFYNLDNACFQRGKAQLPVNANHIISTPDGACFVAFVKDGNSTINFTTDSTTNFSTDSSIKELIDVTGEINKTPIKLHVYFYEKFTKNALKVVDCPFAVSSINLTNFSIFGNRQIYLTTIDQKNGNFQSVLVKITHAKTKFRFERQQNLKLLGQVKFEGAHSSLVFGKNTKFTQDVQKGDFLIIGSEKRAISEIQSDFELKVDNSFKHVEPEKFYNFRIESRSFHNGLLDAYSMVFTKYAINSPIGKIDKPLSVYIALNLKFHKIGDYSGKFPEYFYKMWRKFEEETKKPIGHINNFKLSFIPYRHYDIDELLTEYLFGEYVIAEYS